MKWQRRQEDNLIWQTFIQKVTSSDVVLDQPERLGWQDSVQTRVLTWVKSSEVAARCKVRFNYRALSILLVANYFDFELSQIILLNTLFSF